MGSDGDITGKKIYADLVTCFDNDPGRRVLRWLERVLGVKESLTPEEAFNQRMLDEGRLDVPHRPIDPVAEGYRKGMRRAYYKLEVMVEAAKKNREGG